MERIILKNISKKFKIGHNKNRSALSKIISLVSGVEQKKEFWALKNISFTVKEGETLGVIGVNSSGKSTLLRTIAGIYKKDKGKVKTEGRAVYLAAYGQWLNPRLTMKDNVFLMGSILGLSQKDIKKRFKDIVEFSGLKDYTNTKIHQFSSGMITRLNFSVRVHCLSHQNPDIILLDEVIGSSGDINFHIKAMKKIEELIKGGASIVLVSHNMSIIRKYCKKVLWIDKGSIVKGGKADNIIKAYEKEGKNL